MGFHTTEANPFVTNYKLCCHNAQSKIDKCLKNIKCSKKKFNPSTYSIFSYGILQIHQLFIQPLVKTFIILRKPQRHVQEPYTQQTNSTFAGSIELQNSTKIKSEWGFIPPPPKKKISLFLIQWQLFSFRHQI